MDSTLVIINPGATFFLRLGKDKEDTMYSTIFLLSFSLLIFLAGSQRTGSLQRLSPVLDSAFQQGADHRGQKLQVIVHIFSSY